MGIPLLKGREFNTSDTANSQKVAVINESMVRRFFGDREPIGAKFAFGAGDKVKPDIEIIGVVKDSKHANVREQAKPFVYTPYSQFKTIGGNHILRQDETGCRPDDRFASQRECRGWTLTCLYSA